MIVPAMTVEEIQKEVCEDWKNVINKLHEWERDFKKAVLRSKRFPLRRTYEYHTPVKKNLFIMSMMATKRSRWKNPLANVFGVYSRRDGVYLISISTDDKKINIYPPHFFKRYRERIVKDELISNPELIRQYCRNYLGFSRQFMTKESESAYQSFEREHINEKISFVAATFEGFCFGEKQGDVSIFKTIVSEEMLFEDQKLIFRELKDELRQAYIDELGIVV